MQIILLEAIHYPADGSSWHSIDTPHPDWPSIECAIRRLDRDEWPMVWLHTTPRMEEEMPENGLCIVGGRGEYGVFLTRDGDEIHYHNRSRGSALVHIWESDQGSIVQERWLCNDLEVVFAMARYFAERARLDPNQEWVQW